MKITDNNMGKSNLGSVSYGRENNLAIIRLFAILMVLYSHSFILSGSTEPTPPFLDGGYGPIGLNIFFIISGFLVTQSYLRMQDPARFIWSRFLRIIPGLLVALILSAFVLGPLVTTLQLNEYFTNLKTYTHLLLLTFFLGHYDLPGVFQNNPFPSTVNGSLWMLKYIVVFYAVILLFGITKVLDKKRIILMIFFLCFALHHFKVGESSYLFMLSIDQSLRLFTYFGLGMVAYLYRDSIPMNMSYFAFCVIILLIASVKKGLNESLFLFILTYLVLYLGFNKKTYLSWLSKIDDISYGVFIYSFPVQQTVVYLYGGKMNPWINFSISVVFSILFGVLSWFCCEKRCLKLKDISLVGGVWKRDS